MLSLGDCWGFLSYQKRRSGFWKRGGSADGELKGRAAGGLQDQPWSSGRGGEVVHGDRWGGLMRDGNCSNAFFPSVLPAHR